MLHAPLLLFLFLVSTIRQQFSPRLSSTTTTTSVWTPGDFSAAANSANGQKNLPVEPTRRRVLLSSLFDFIRYDKLILRSPVSPDWTRALAQITQTFHLVSSNSLKDFESRNIISG